MNPVSIEVSKVDSFIHISDHKGLQNSAPNVKGPPTIKNHINSKHSVVSLLGIFGKALKQS